MISFLMQDKCYVNAWLELHLFRHCVCGCAGASVFFPLRPFSKGCFLQGRCEASLSSHRRAAVVNGPIWIQGFLSFDWFRTLPLSPPNLHSNAEGRELMSPGSKWGGRRGGMCSGHKPSNKRQRDDRSWHKRSRWLEKSHQRWGQLCF